MLTLSLPSQNIKIRLRVMKSANPRKFRVIREPCAFSIAKNTPKTDENTTKHPKTVKR